MAPLYGASVSPGPSPRRRVGTFTICWPGEFSIEKCNPALAGISWSWRAPNLGRVVTSPGRRGLGLYLLRPTRRVSPIAREPNCWTPARKFTVAATG